MARVLAEQRGQEKGTAHPDPFDEETPDLGNDDQSYVPSMEKEGAKEITVAGLVLVARDPGGRALLLQRAVSSDDPASGKWEYPGGHLEEGESPLEGAIREWKEEVGCPLPPGEVKASQVQPNGIYQLFVYVVESEDVLDINGSPDDRQVLSPDDPDQDNIEVVAWWSVKDIKDNPAVRKEVQSTDWSIFSKALRKTSAKVSKYLQNPRDKTDDWHHGSPKEFDNPEPGQEEGLNEHPHWNAYLGTHWTSLLQVAAKFARDKYSKFQDRPKGSGHVLTANLAISKPKRYASEFDMDSEAYNHAWEHFAPHDPDGWDKEDLKADPEMAAHVRNTWDRPGGSAYWLGNHPQAKEMAESFKNHLQSQGHDGVVYGNEWETPKGHKCAITFDPSQHHNVRSRQTKTSAAPEHETWFDPEDIDHVRKTWAALARLAATVPCECGHPQSDHSRNRGTCTTCWRIAV